MKLSKKDIEGINKMYHEIEKSAIIDKKIQKSLETEKSYIGKELLLCDQVYAIHDKLPKAKYQIILYLIRLFKYNNQIYESLKRELANDKNLLQKRINKTFKEKNAHGEIYLNILKLANKHFIKGKTYLKNFDEDDASTHHHAHLSLHHKNKAEELYNELLAKDVKRVIKHLALVKLSEVYAHMMLKCEHLSKLIPEVIKKIEQAHAEIQNDLYNIHRLVAEQNLSLRHFAINYSKSLVHAAEYMDNLSNRVILYEHKP